MIFHVVTLLFGDIDKIRKFGNYQKLWLSFAFIQVTPFFLQQFSGQHLAIYKHGHQGTGVLIL